MTNTRSCRMQVREFRMSSDIILGLTVVAEPQCWPAPDFLDVRHDQEQVLDKPGPAQVCGSDGTASGQPEPGRRESDYAGWGLVPPPSEALAEAALTRLVGG